MEQNHLRGCEVDQRFAVRHREHSIQSSTVMDRLLHGTTVRDSNSEKNVTV